MFRDARLGLRRSVALWWLLAAAILASLLIARAAGAAPAELSENATRQAAESAGSKAERSATNGGDAVSSEVQEADDETPIYKTNAEWKRLLTRKQYRVARLGETEPPFQGKYCKNKAPGEYRCICCDAMLFSSQTKFESGTGWPSFWAPAKEKRLVVRQDFSDGSLRIEVLCSRCGAHLGHVFNDGPPPTGLRFCINSASLDFKDVVSNASDAATEYDDSAQSKRRTQHR